MEYSFQWNPRPGCVAVVALSTDKLKRDVVGINTAGDSTIVATETDADDMIMVDPYDT